MKGSPGDSNNKKRDGNNWPGQPHQEKAPHSVQGGHGAHRHKGGEERASAAAIGEESRDDKKLQN